MVFMWAAIHWLPMDAGLDVQDGADAWGRWCCGNIFWQRRFKPVLGSDRGMGGRVAKCVTSLTSSGQHLQPM